MAATFTGCRGDPLKDARKACAVNTKRWATSSNEAVEAAGKLDPGKFREWLLARPKPELVEMVRDLSAKLRFACLQADLLRKGSAGVAAERAQLGGIARHLKAPQHAAKQKAFQFWLERRAGKHPKLRTNEQFAAECMRRWPVLTSAKVILGWCTEWNKQAKRKP